MSENPIYVAFTDGGSRGNPGNSACAFVVFDNNGIMTHHNREFLGVRTNNYAEYCGLVCALRHFAGIVHDGVHIYMDSELIVKQMNGEYAVKSPELRPLYETAKLLTERITNFSISHIPREENVIADQYVNIVLDMEEAKENEEVAA